MTNAPVDLRSDTFTRPTPAMRRAMAEAEVGDDVYGEDPTVNRLQARAAQLFEREAALFVPTGCMGNLISIMAWAQRTNEVICEERSHVNLYELASMCTIAGCFPRPRYAPDGILTWELIEPLIVAMAFGATVQQYAQIPHLHPTLVEILTYPAEEIAEKLISTAPLAVAQ